MGLLKNRKPQMPSSAGWRRMYSGRHGVIMIKPERLARKILDRRKKSIILEAK